MRKAEFEAWAIRVFGSIAAFRCALPEREWIHGDNGWYSARRRPA